ncbi:MAG: YggT family protein [Zoogloea sp.]|nr:YggT family protein [Zoogloea sp.]
MLASLLMLVLNTAGSFLTALLLGRCAMQWFRVPFRNPLGHFVLASTDWLVLRLRRFVPPLWGLDLASLLPAWVVQAFLVFVQVWLHGGLEVDNPGGMLLVVWGVGLLELARVALYLLMGLVLLSAVLSWVNPYSPAAPMIQALAEPFLRPFRRIIPTIGNVDLSPLVLLLVLQVGLALLTYARFALAGLA